MAKHTVEIDPAIYATEFLARREMIWKGMSSFGDHVKDPIAYINRMQKRYGAIVKEAASLAYEPLYEHCLAVVETKIDEALCERYGWKTIQEWRDESFKEFKNKYLTQ